MCKICNEPTTLKRENGDTVCTGCQIEMDTCSYGKEGSND